MRLRRYLLTVTLFSLTVMLFYLLNCGVHWNGIFRPLALGLIRGDNPYTSDAYFNPPWALIPIIPFALLPSRLGFALYASVSMWAIGYVAYRRGARKWMLAAYLAMPLTFYNGLDVNVDWMVAVGYILPPVWGLPLVLIKPQLGIGVAFYWAVRTFKDGGIKSTVLTFTPAAILFGLSIFMYGNYFLKYERLIKSQEVLWFTSIPVAVVLLAFALRENKAGYAIAASPFLAPYISPGSLPIALLGIIEHPHLSLPALLGLWILSIEEIAYLLIKIL